ncbi:DMSO/TMAO reductase YedYZ, molybdopterin-dependent catalytic subunit [Lentzea xinjiangensis]|uniref:DMSO/TMAO reductase YedYZ, molybdopterin-dependent catalytic subunit n=2 Tax=Lentzea xinjiangensis TaxID=402600 RepID=A0A1H9VLX3_9PSEU|nr:DMSO/TMAO reductase YedYZ, molybdopterin-dependent catalytic subunit [Lentzea xinjiangensis]
MWWADSVVRMISRRGVLLAAGLSLLPSRASAAPSIVKPLPATDFVVHGTNAETRWEALRGTGSLTPVSKFFVRNHTSTPLLDATSWRLRIHGSGVSRPLSLSVRDLRALPSCSVEAVIECAGNGRSFFTSQQGQAVAGTPWRLGGIGNARWRGVPLGLLLRLAGLRAGAVDVLPAGLDADYVTGGVNLGRVRRPLPVAKALDDVLVAYEMNGADLPPDHGFPARLVVPGWAGIASIKWLGSIEVSTSPLHSPWDTQYYRLLGPAHPPEGTPVTEQVAKSAFELAWGATVPAGRHVLTGRAWAPGGVRRVEVSTDGRTWRRATLVSRGGWTRWQLPWQAAPGEHVLRVRADDQPDESPYNTQGYLFGAVVRHPVTVV